MLRRTLSRVIKRLIKLQPQGNYITHGRSCSDSTKLSNQSELDYEYLVNPTNSREIEENIKRRKGSGNIQKVIELYTEMCSEGNPLKKDKVFELLKKEASNIPNRTHPTVMGYGNEPVKIRGSESVEFSFNPREFHDLAHSLRLLRTEGLADVTGRRSYYFLGELAELERALVQYTLEKLMQKNFKLISVPDILPKEIINGCGMRTDGERTQIYQLEDIHGEDLCLSGTAEMAFGGLFSNRILDINELPVCVASASRCFRAEGSGLKDEGGIYRVFNFTKVEMFGLCHPLESEKLFDNFVETQEEIFKSFGLDFRILDMPMHELGASAYRKFDMEAWLPGREMYGEISSCSNCTDFQARRLNIKFRDRDETNYVHTVNGTACAVPRTIMAIFETHQLQNGNVRIPKPLRKYFAGREEITKKIVIPSAEKEAEERIA